MQLRRPSASLVVATVAVVVAGSGSAVAAGLITSAKIQNGTIQLADISATAKKSLRGARGPAGAAGAAGRNGINGTNGANGAPGAAGVPGSARAYARVTWYLPATGAPGFVAGFTKGFSSVVETSTGRYCLTPDAGVDLTNKPVLLTVDWSQTVDPVGNASASWLPDAAECPAPKIGVETMRIPDDGGPADVDDETSFSIMVP